MIEIGLGLIETIEVGLIEPIEIELIEIINMVNVIKTNFKTALMVNMIKKHINSNINVQQKHKQK